MLERFPRRPSLTLVGAVALVLAIANPAAAPPGDLDASFDGDGKVTTNFAGSTDTAFAVAIQADGKIVTAGLAAVSGFNFGLARHNTDGSLDITFDGDGKVTTDFVGSADQANTLAIQADGKIVAAGQAEVSGLSDFALVRYNTDGSIDTTFDGDGKVSTDFAGGSDQARAVAIQGDGKIVTAGFAIFSGISEFALARYNTDGSLDTTFDGDGKVTTNFAGSAALGMAIQGDGKVVAVGRAFVSGSQDFALARYNVDGSLDTTFDGDGKVTTDFAGGRDEALAVALQGNGRIVTAGLATFSGINDFALARYQTDGSLDTTFDGDGKVTTDFAGGVDQAHGVTLQVDGRIVAAGPSFVSGTFDFALARYDTNGALDTTFSMDGKVTTGFGNDDENVAVAIQGDRKIVTAGFSNVSGTYDFALARYLPDADSDLSITKSGPAGRVPTGRNMTYTLTVTNHGPDSASGVTVTDQLPSSVTFVSASATEGSCGESNGTVFCTLGEMSSGAIVTIEIVVRPTTAGMITNSASVASPTPDSNQGNNSDSEDTSICRITSRRSSIPCG